MLESIEVGREVGITYSEGPRYTVCTFLSPIVCLIFLHHLIHEPTVQKVQKPHAVELFTSNSVGFVLPQSPGCIFALQFCNFVFINKLPS